MKKSTKYKIYFSVWSICVLFWFLVAGPFTWSTKDEKNVIIENPMVKRPFRNKRNSVEQLYFTNKLDGTSYHIRCSALKIINNERENFCDWYDGKNPKHKVSSVKKISIVYLHTNSNYEKNRKIRLHSFVKNIEFLDENSNTHYLTIDEKVIHNEIKRDLSLVWGSPIALSIAFFPDIFEKISYEIRKRYNLDKDQSEINKKNKSGGNKNDSDGKKA